MTGSPGRGAAFTRPLPSAPMALTDRFSPFGLALLGVLLLGLLFFAFLMSQRGDDGGGAERDGDGGQVQTDGTGSTTATGR
jgi:hypothetical protein